MMKACIDARSAAWPLTRFGGSGGARLIAVLCLAAMSATQAMSQDYPTRPLRLVTGSAGGANDLITRVIAQGLSAAVGQPAVVENKPSGVLEGEAVVNAKPDGHTLLSTSANLWISGLMQKVPFDALRDFRPITLATTAPYILVVNPHLPVKSVPDLIALAKARPGELNYVSLAVGSSNHLAMELFKSLTGADFEFTSWGGLLAPAGIPTTIVRKLHLETVKALALPDLRTRLADLGLEGIGNSPDEFAAVIKSEIPKWAKVIKDAGIKAD
jgi:tripartite-type tricarboxylate transporter receptor subunit TctC